MTTPIARFQVNGIEVGSLPRNTYDSIVEAVRRDKRIYLVYAARLVLAVARWARLVVACLPGFVFGLFALMAFFDPASFTSLVADLRAAEPADITQQVRALLALCLFALLFLLPMAIGFKPSFARFDNPFAEAVSKRVRGLLEVPTEGELTVTFYETAPEQRD